MSSKAIVTLAIGEACRTQWETLCRANWQAYASRHGYDLVCIDQPLDTSERAGRRSPAWQKCLILSGELSRYEKVVWIDADILINEQAPCIADATPAGAVGAVDLWSAPTKADFLEAWTRLQWIWNKERAEGAGPGAAAAYYTDWGLPEGCDEVITTSVMSLSPGCHREILERVYNEYEDRGESTWHYEMRPLSYELIKSGLVHWLDPRFSTSWSIQMALHYPFLLQRNPRERFGRRLLRQIVAGESYEKMFRRCINASFQNSFFFHFGPRKAEMPLVEATAGYRSLRSQPWFKIS